MPDTPDSEIISIIRKQFPLESILEVVYLDQSHSYKLIRELGKGNFGITFMAQELGNEDIVALKVEPETYGKTSNAVFEQIQLLLANSKYFPKFRFHGIINYVEHNGIKSNPKIISQYFIPVLQGVSLESLMRANPTINPNILKSLLQQSSVIQFTCTVMDFVKGIPLDQRKFPPHISTFYIWQAAKGVAELHSQKIIHADIKPENIMIDLGGKVKILDFTTAYISNSQLQKGGALATSLFSPWGHILGQNPSEYSDIYGLGAVLYYLATGTEPEERTTTSVPFSTTVYCRYYSKISSIQRPLRKLLMAIFAENTKLVQSNNTFQSKLNVKYIAQILTEEREFVNLEPVTSAEKLLECLVPLVKEYEPQRRIAWDKLYKEQLNINKKEAEKRWLQTLEVTNSYDQTDILIEEEYQIRRKAEYALRVEWDSEIQHRLEIDSELGFVSDAEEERARDSEEKSRMPAWEESLSQWQRNARNQLQEKLSDKWAKSHEQEWNLEIERQMEWDRQRWGLKAQWCKHFDDARQKQQQLPLELEKEEYWAEEVKKFDNRIDQYLTELKKEQTKRKGSIDNLVSARVSEKRRRMAFSKPDSSEAFFKEWEQKERQAIITLQKGYQVQLGLLQDLRKYKSLMQAEEIHRIESRSFREKIIDRMTTVGIGLTKLTKSIVQKAKTILVILAILATILFCGYAVWHSNSLPNLEKANNFAIQGDTQINEGIQLEKQGQVAEANKKYRSALDAYLKAEAIFDKYFRLYPNEKSNDTSIAHYNASACGWNSYLILNTLNDPSLPSPLEQLIFAEKQLEIYNNDNPSKTNEENLLKYNIYILMLSNTSDYIQSLKSLEEIMNRIQSLQLSLAPEDQLTLYNLAQKVCANDMPDLQKARCETILEKLK